MAYGALGGGTFLVQNKVLPGTFINYISLKRPSNLFTDRGFATIALPLDWGKDNGIITVDNEELQKNSMKLLGYEYTAPQLTAIRDIMKGAKTLYLYKLNGGGAKATATATTLTVTAAHSGTRGNNLQIVVENDIDVENGFIVTTYIDTIKLDIQRVLKVDDFIPNGYVILTGELVTTAGLKLTGGTNGTVTGQSHTDYLTIVENFDFNVIGYDGEDDVVKGLYVAFVDRMRIEEGIKIQAVMHDKKADNEGIINVKNNKEAIYWVLGQSAGCDINKSLTNKKYDGESPINIIYDKKELKKALAEGYFVFYQINDEVKVLEDINSYVTFVPEKNQDFKQNQVIRVLDQRAKDVAIIFNQRYLGKVLNNQDGRISFWGELTTHANTLQNLGAIEEYVPEDTIIEKGIEKDSVVVTETLQPVMAMQKLYYTIYVQ